MQRQVLCMAGISDGAISVKRETGSGMLGQ
jgi:hypothetical protein